jgi:hypothetical protein
MKKIIFATTLLITSICLSAQKNKDLKPFTGIAVAGNIKVELVPTQGQTKIEYTVIKGDENNFKIENENTVLKLSVENNWLGMSDTKIEAKVYYNTLNKVKTGAGASLKGASKLNAETMEISASSGSRLEVIIDSKNTNISSSSGSSIYISGTSAEGNISVSSGASAKCPNLIFDDVNASASSGASAEINVKNSLTAKASSGGSVSYDGNPQTVNKNRSSGGSISKN